MVVSDFHFTGIAIAPFKADAPLAVDPNAPLVFAVAGKLLKHVARRASQIVQGRRGMNGLELLTRPLLNVHRQPADPAAIKHSGSLFVGECPDHTLQSIMFSVKRQESGISMKGLP